MALRLSVVFRQIVSLSSFPACWRQANPTLIPKGPPPSSVDNNLPIFITSVLSNSFERLVFVRLGRFIERSGVFPPATLPIGKHWVPVIHVCVCPIHSKVHWRVGRILGSCRLISVQPFIGSTIRVFSISSALWVRSSVLSILMQFQSNRSQHVMVDILSE